VTQDLLDASDAEAVAALTMTSIETILEFEVAGMWLADADRERLEPVALTGQREGLVAEMPTYTAADGGLSWAAYSTNSARTIDDMREHERELREQEAEVARERDRLDAFAGVVSHDLRNPLHVASSRLELFADERDQVFESGYSTAGGSSGLGLSIVRRIVTAHGWEIRVVEGERGGARFEVTGVDAV
jgi:signal transduction histidine kinase